MEHYILDRWQDRYMGLAYYDTQGCYLRERPFRHYMGNFWWARASYVLGLPDPMSFEVKPYPGMQFEETKPSRMRYEQWILLNDGSHCNIIPFPENAAKLMPGYSPEFTPYEDDISLL